MFTLNHVPLKMLWCTDWTKNDLKKKQQMKMRLCRLDEKNMKKTGLHRDVFTVLDLRIS